MFFEFKRKKNVKHPYEVEQPEINEANPIGYEETNKTVFSLHNTQTEYLFYKYRFEPEYFKGCQCYAEIILLAKLIFLILSYYPGSQTIKDVINILDVIIVIPKDAPLTAHLTTDDGYYEREITITVTEIYPLQNILRENDNYMEEKQPLPNLYYERLRMANESKIRDAVIALYEYYTWGIYPIENEEPWIETQNNVSNTNKKENYINMDDIFENNDD